MSVCIILCIVFYVLPFGVMDNVDDDDHDSISLLILFFFFRDGVTSSKKPKADVRHATKLGNFVAELYRATNLPRQLSIFHWQTIDRPTNMASIVTQTTI